MTTAVTEKQILEALSRVQGPELHRSLTELKDEGRIEEVSLPEMPGLLDAFLRAVPVRCGG